MKKNYTFQKSLMLLPLFLLGSIMANAQGNDPGVMPQSKNSILLAPAGLTNTQLPVPAPDNLTRDVDTYGNNLQFSNFHPIDTIVWDGSQPKDVWEGYVGWKDNPDTIGVYFDKTWTDAQKDSIKKAMNTWNAAGCKPKFKVVSKSSDAKVTVTKGKVDKGIGVCKREQDPVTKKRTGAKITLEHPASIGLVELATHELGHAIGLNDTDAAKNTKDVMKGRGANGTNGDLSKHDSTELKAAMKASDASVSSPVEKKKAFSPETAIIPGDFGMLIFDLIDFYPPGTTVFVESVEDDLLFVESAFINDNLLEVGVFSDPGHGSGTLYLDITLIPPGGIEENFWGIHYINQMPAPPVIFECPFLVTNTNGEIYIEWEDLHTYPFDNPLRATLVINQNTSYDTKPIGDFYFELAPGNYFVELFVDDYQVNSAYYAMEIIVEPTAPPWEEPFEDYIVGSDIVGQGGWEFWGGGTSSPTARVTNTQVHTGDQALEIQGKADFTGDDIVHQFSGCTSGVWEISTWQYIPEDAAGGTTYFVLLDQYGNDIADCHWSTQIKIDPDLGIIESEGEGATLPLVKGQWAEISVVVDLDNDEQTISYNGQVLSTKSWTLGIPQAEPGILNIAAIDFWTNDLANVPVYYDDIKITIAQPCPIVYAGPDATIVVEGASYTLADAFGEEYSSVLWTGGAGLFDDPSLLNPTYTPNPSEYGTTVTLCIEAFPISPCTVSAIDCMDLTISPNWGLVDVDAFQVSYDWGESSQPNSRVGLISATYIPDEQIQYFNTFTVNVFGEIYWMGQNFLPEAIYSPVAQKTTIPFDLMELGIEPGETIDSCPLWVIISPEPILVIPDLPPVETWPIYPVNELLDNTCGGGGGPDLTISGASDPLIWPYYINPLTWLGEIEKLVYRGCNVPNIDLDSSGHPHNEATGYAGDLNACCPAGMSNSIKWLEGIYKDHDPSLDTEQTHREVLEDLSGEIGRQPNSGPPSHGSIMEGKMKYTQKHRLPIRTKFQYVPIAGQTDGDIRPEGSNYAAENQTGDSGKPDWDWLMGELEDGEDVEMNYQPWDEANNRWAPSGSHTVVITGAIQLSSGFRGLWIKHDRDQVNEDSTRVVQDPTAVTVDEDGWITLPTISREGFPIRVYGLISESYDSTVTYERVSGTLEDAEGNAVTPENAGIKVRRWDNPDDSLTVASGGVKYEIIDGVGFFDIDFDDFETPLKPGDRIHITFFDGERWVTRIVIINENGDPVWLDVIVEDEMIVEFEFTQWQQITIPPHKTLKVEYLDVGGCGNTDIVQWNGDDWYVPAYGFWNHNPSGTENEISNDTDQAQFKRIHCDDRHGFTLKFSLVESTGNTTISNQNMYAVVNVGGNDYTNIEFGEIEDVDYTFIYDVGSVLSDFPQTMGGSGVQNLEIQFESYDNIYWEDMELQIDLVDAIEGGNLTVEIDDKGSSKESIFIASGQTVVNIPMGAISGPGFHSMMLSVDATLNFGFDCFNFSSVHEPDGDMDFGDAPVSYQTLLADGGSHHILDGVTFLGDLIDTEPDGQPTVNADGDDLNNLDDEDGVVFRTPLVAGQNATIKVKASVDGILNVWLDLNRNGTWADAVDHVFNDVNLTAGWNTLTLGVPANAAVGNTYMRFRFDTDGGLDYFGTAPNGEVEDYKVSILPESWGFLFTASNHLISVPFDVSLIGITLSANDVLGVFYTDDLGNMACGGAEIYDGINNQIVLAYGNDGTTPEKDGFNGGEELKWKIYLTASGEEQWVDVEYDPLLPNHDGTFVNGGLSALSSITANCQELVMFEGWSGISSYIVPDDPDLEDMFNFSEFIILQNLSGYYWPPTNTLGDWDEHSGYAIKVSADATLDVCGFDVTDKTVNLDSLWNVIPVLSKTDVDAATFLGGATGFYVAKEVAGYGVLWPTYGVNTLGNLQPGKSYFVYMTTPGSITYTAKGGSVYPGEPFELVNVSPWNDVHHSPGTHVVAFAPDAVSTFEKGDFIGAFTQTNLCAGMMVVAQEGVGLVLNGDDVYTGQTDGFVSGESIAYKLYRPGTEQVFDLKVEYEPKLDNSGLFHINSMSAITGVTLTGIETQPGLEGSGIRIYPNPSPGIFNIEGVAGKAEITIFNAFGEEVLYKDMASPGQVDLTGHPKGIYFIRITTEKGMHFEKLVVN